MEFYPPFTVTLCSHGRNRSPKWPNMSSTWIQPIVARESIIKSFKSNIHPAYRWSSTHPDDVKYEPREPSEPNVWSVPISQNFPEVLAMIVKHQFLVNRGSLWSVTPEQLKLAALCPPSQSESLLLFTHLVIGGKNPELEITLEKPWHLQNDLRLKHCLVFWSSTGHANHPVWQTTSESCQIHSLSGLATSDPTAYPCQGEERGFACQMFEGSVITCITLYYCNTKAWWYTLGILRPRFPIETYRNGSGE